MKASKIITLGLVAASAGLIMGATALPAQAVPPAEPQGCHGAATVAYKKAVNDSGGQGSAIGGLGNSDGSPLNGQAHDAVGRGQTLQQFLADQCERGSQFVN